ncbi:MAG: hypothetical protein AABX83_02725 [Nanoarchaeota archaeon]
MIGKRTDAGTVKRLAAFKIFEEINLSDNFRTYVIESIGFYDSLERASLYTSSGDTSKGVEKFQAARGYVGYLQSILNVGYLPQHYQQLIDILKEKFNEVAIGMEKIK